MKPTSENTQTLRIKKVFFDQIADGTKKREYRANTLHNRRLLQKPDIRFLKLHYQKPKRLLVEVKKIVKTRSEFTIHLGKAKLYFKK